MSIDLTDLDDRLRALGTHLDHERAAITAATNVVVPFGPRHRSSVRTVLAAAAAAAVIIGLVAVATNRTGTPDVPATIPPTTTATPAIAVTLPGRSVQIRPVIEQCSVPAVMPSATDDAPAEATLLLPLLGSEPPTACTVGPALGDGSVFDGDATVTTIEGVGPAVVVSLRPGAAGEDVWNALAAHCYNGDDVCPTKQIAIVLGGSIFSAPTVQTPTFTGSIQIAGALTDAEANELANAINSL